MQRDEVSNKLAVDLGSAIDVASTGDQAADSDLDTKGARAVSFVITPSAAIAAFVGRFQLLESDDDGSADPYTPVAEDKYLPTSLADTVGGEAGIPIVAANAPYSLLAGAVGTKRWLRASFHTDTGQSALTIALTAVMEMETGPQTSVWNSTVTGVDGNP